MANNIIKVCGHDPSLRNWGIAVGTYNILTNEILIEYLDVINPVISKGKQVRQNSLDLESAYQLYSDAYKHTKDTQANFIEVPIGSQSARAMASYGICVGVLGALKANGIPFYEVTPTEVKLAGYGNKNATKEQMIEWAIKTHPEAKFPTYKTNGLIKVTAAKAEHMADAIGAIHAGVSSTQFKQLIALLK